MEKLLKSVQNFFLFLGVILFEETCFAVIMKIHTRNMTSMLLYTIILSAIFSIITNTKKEKMNQIITEIILWILAVLFSVQCTFYHIFKVYFAVSNLGLSDQAAAFYKDGIRFIIQNIPYIIIFLLPIPIYIFVKNKLIFRKDRRKSNLISLGILLVTIPLFIINIELQKGKGQNNLYDLYHDMNEISLNIKKLGVLNAYSLDIYRTFFGFQGKVSNVYLTEDEPTEKTKEQKEIEYGYNVTNLSFSKEPYNESIRIINNYIENDPGTKKNEYTGKFEGYNIIYITAESFSEIAISEELTPTLYKMTHSGFVFENFYTPNVLSTIGGEFQALTGLYPDYSILGTWRDGTNYFPYGLGTIFQNLGYNTYAYHDNSYVFQDRDVYIQSQGFTNFKACYNGLEYMINCERWPESDVEMMEATSEEYIHSDQPFLAYYMTVSGHFSYTFDDNGIAYQNRDLVSDLSHLSEEAQAYVATQIELDRALEVLVNKLKAENKLDKTVFVLQADHYPYELDLDYINELSSTYRDETFEINHNALIIWNSELETKKISKPCISIDVLPTVYNLFGVEYDSRLLMGKDILSTSPGIAIMVDHSWITDYGVYNSSTGEFSARKEIPEGYIQNVNTVVNNRLNISRMILENNYYYYLYQ